MQVSRNINLAVIGGGAAGFMGAIKAAEDGTSSVLIFEAAAKALQKVQISGGGRCNVTNACWDPIELVPNYPRGQFPLKGAFSRFATGDTVAWFNERGLELSFEDDGRIFPKSNSSRDVIKCLQNAADSCGVICRTKMGVKKVKFLGERGFLLTCIDNNLFYAKKILLATGSNPTGKTIASNLGHELIPPVPALFSFKIKDFCLNICSGISVENVRLTLLTRNTKFKQEGKILITHKGFSGPVILKMSSFAARQLYLDKYKSLMHINWVNKDNDSLRQLLKNCRINYPSRNLNNFNPFKNIPQRLWISLLRKINIMPDLRWSGLSNANLNDLINILFNDSYSIKGKGPFGEEFVTAGGVSLNEVNFKSMESRKCKGLYFAGEVLDIDGITGGFNFQHCWTSGWIAGASIASELRP